MTLWPFFAEDEISAVTDVLRSGKVNYWTGPHGRTFEKEFADYFGSKHAIALGNGTLALELALRALDIGPGDEVIVPSRTFIATASAVIMMGAKPIVADIDRNSQNITVDTIQQVMTPKTKAIIVVHLGGWPCDMDSIMAFAKQHHLKVIEDCAQAIGAKWNGKYIGTFGDIGAFSFCQDKIITTGGEGGMVTTNSDALWEKMWSYKDHGKDYQKTISNAHPPGFRWLHTDFGSNYRMTEMQAVIGRIQLTKLEDWIKTRTANAHFLMEQLKNVKGLSFPTLNSHIKHAFYRCYAFVDLDALNQGWTRDKLMHEINQKGIPCTVGSCSEIYLEEAFKKRGLTPTNRHTNAKWLSETSLAFLVHPTLTQKDLLEVAKGVESVMQQAISNLVVS